MSDLKLFSIPRRKTNRKRGRTLHVERWGRYTDIARGPHLVGLLDGAGIPRQWLPDADTWAYPTNRRDDLLAYAEHSEGRVITIERAAA